MIRASFGYVGVGEHLFVVDFVLAVCRFQRRPRRVAEHVRPASATDVVPSAAKVVAQLAGVCVPPPDGVAAAGIVAAGVVAGVVAATVFSAGVVASGGVAADGPEAGWKWEENYRAPPRPSGVAAFMSAHSKTPYITPSMDFSSGKGVVRGRGGQQLGFALRDHAAARELQSAPTPQWGRSIHVSPQ